MEHSDLVQEMTLLEKLTAQERLKQAKRRRQQQITAWLQLEETTKDNSTDGSMSINAQTKRKGSIDPIDGAIRSRKGHVQFPENIILLEGKIALSSH